MKIEAEDWGLGCTVEVVELSTAVWVEGSVFASLGAKEKVLRVLMPRIASKKIS
jgi:hypothetical protein